MDKKKILITGTIIIIILFALSFIYFIFLKKQKEGENIPAERTLKEILETDFTAPISEIGAKVSQEVIKNLSVPGKKKIPLVPEEIIESLTAPN